LSCLKAVGCSIVYSANFEFVLIGPERERWDILFNSQYQSATAYVSMIKNPNDRRVVMHRQATVRNTRLIQLLPKKSRDLFG
jgi:hypothetical protein